MLKKDNETMSRQVFVLVTQCDGKIISDLIGGCILQYAHNFPQMQLTIETVDEIESPDDIGY